MRYGGAVGEALARHVLLVVAPRWDARAVGAIVGGMAWAIVDGEAGRSESLLRVESRAFGTGGAIMTSRAALAVGARLLMAGGTGMTSGSAHVEHTRAQWLELELRTRRGGKEEVEAALAAAFVRRVVSEEGVGTCGMHMMGRAEVVVRGGGSGSRGGSGSGSGAEGRLIEGVVRGEIALAEGGVVEHEGAAYRVQTTRYSAWAEDDPRWNPWGCRVLTPVTRA